MWLCRLCNELSVVCVDIRFLVPQMTQTLATLVKYSGILQVVCCWPGSWSTSVSSKASSRRERSVIVRVCCEGARNEAKTSGLNERNSENQKFVQAEVDRSSHS